VAVTVNGCASLMPAGDVATIIEGVTMVTLTVFVPDALL
jgi:hypothetical protein